MRVYVQNKLISLRGSSTVVDEHNTPIYKVNGKFFTVTNKKRVCDMSGKVLYNVRNRWINLFARKVYISDKNGKRVATVRNKFFTVKQHYFVEGKDCSIEIEGEFFSLLCQIKRDGVVIGTIRREITIFKDSFELEASEADIPFCIALVIAIDNIVDSYKSSR